MIDVGWWSRAHAAGTTRTALAATCTILACATSLLGCGDDATMPPPGADGGTIADAGFDPDSSALPGEGDACRFSIECADLQICVDDHCVRHERIAPGNLELGEMRWLGPGTIESTALLPAGAWQGNGDYMPSWVVPGEHGSQLVFLLMNSVAPVSPFSCDVAVVGEHTRVVHVADFYCHAATASPIGEVAIFGRGAAGLEFRRYDAAGSEVQRVSDFTPVVRELQTIVQPDSELYGATSLLFDGTDVLVAVRLGRLVSGHVQLTPCPPPPCVMSDGIVALRVPLGAMPSLVDAGGEKVFLRDAGWLVHDAAGVQLIVEGAVDWPTSYPIELRSLETGETRTLIEAPASHYARYAQPEPDQWVLVLRDDRADPVPTCTLHVIDSAGVDTTLTRTPSADCDGSGPRYPSRNTALPVPIVPGWIGDPAIFLIDRFNTYSQSDMRTPYVNPFYDPVDRAGGLGAVAPVRRFHRTIEGGIGVYPMSPPFDWFEFPLRRRGGGT